MKRLFWVALCVGLLACGLAACGQTGGPTVTETPSVAPTVIRTSEPTKPPAFRYSNYVAVLVVDDFRNTLPDPETLRKDSLCVATLREQEVFKARGGGLSDSSDKAHGWLVYEELETQIKRWAISSISVPTATVTDALQMILWESANDGNILLVAVDTEGFETTVIRNRIAAIVGKLTDNNPPAPLAPLTRSVVLNMSFVFVPCDEIADPTTYISGLAQSGYSLDFIDSMRADPLYNMIIGEMMDGVKPLSVPVVAVAAAGNESAEFPYAPAILDGIVGVSASLPVWPVVVDDCSILPGDFAIQCKDHFSDTSKAWYSNYGIVALDGDHSTATVTLTDTQGITMTIPLPGTSFAAPRMSFWVARYLLVDASNASATNCPLLYPLSGNWKNWSLEAAAHYSCTNFLQP